ncbi:HEPN domain-containing protein [Spirosoma pulveris]
MSGTKVDLVKYRLERADMTLATARLLIEGKDWFGAANRLYYAVYQAVSALMTQEDIRIKSHSGAKAMLELHFIKTGRIEKK